MPVLDKINQAENQADELRAKAKLEVAEMLEQNNKDNIKKMQSMIDEAKNEIKNLNKQTQNHLRELEVNTKEDCEKQNQADSILAKTHLDETVDFILRKVTDS